MKSGGLVREAQTGGCRAAGAALRPGLGLALAASLLVGCTAIVDLEADQCEVDADCVAFPGTSCLDNVCAAPVAECTTNAECVASHGAYHICRKSDHSCQPLQSALCTTVDGDYEDDAALIIGSVGPTSGADELTGKTIENSIKLAMADFDTAANGLPPAPGSSARRPLVLVGCDDQSDQDTAAAAASHLVSTVGVPAIIGAAFSGITINMATEVTIPGGVLTISPSATSPLITDLDDDGLVWRTAPTDFLQAAAVRAYMPFLEQQVRTALALQPSDKIKVLVLNKGDAYGQGLAEALEPTLEFNGALALDPANDGFYVRFDYGDPDNATVNPPDFAGAVLTALDEKPHVILTFGTTEAVTDIFAPVEQQWASSLPTVSYDALWLFSDGGLVPSLWSAVGTNDALRRRVTGTVPGTTDILFQSYRQNFNLAAFGDGTSPDVFGGAGAYDATYLIAYGTVALGGDAVTGANLAAMLAAGRLGSSPTPPSDVVNVGKTGINGALQKLAAGQSVDFQGASGPLDFDVATGEAASDIQIWCMPADAGGNAESGISSGVYYSAGSGALVGSTFGAQCEF